MRVAVAGTFGPIHDGHRSLIRTALERGTDGVVVGLTTDEFARSSRERAVPALRDRLTSLVGTLASLDRWGREVEIRAIDDEFGFADDDPTIDAIVVSVETTPEARRINDTRRDRGLDPLAIVVQPDVLAADGERISSTRIVRGEIDEHGKVQV